MPVSRSSTSSIPPGVSSPIIVGLVIPQEILRFGLEHAWSTSTEIRIRIATGLWNDIRPKLMSGELSMVIATVDTPSSVEILVDLKSCLPNLQVLALASRMDHEVVQRLTAAGVQGFLFQNAAISRVESALQWIRVGRKVYDQESEFFSGLPGSMSALRAAPETISITRLESRETEWVGPAMNSNPSAGHFKGLSTREREVFDGLVDGLTNQQIADRLFLSIKTIETYRSRLRRKLGVTDRASMVALRAQSTSL
ncbi:MAG: response regulator transcription factor [Planctomycetota bacterium]